VNQHTPASRILAAVIVTVLLAFAPRSAAAADDGGPDASMTGTGADATTPASDAQESTSDARHDDTDAHELVDASPDAAVCIAVGQPCSMHETCCNNAAYCGAFGASGGSLVCGLDNANQLSTGSCDTAAKSGGEGAVWLGIVGLAIGASVRRKRRAH